MGLFDKIFRPKKNKEMNAALENASTTFKLLSAYEPVYTDWRGAIYESLQCRAAIDVYARHISKLKVEISGTANPRLRNLLKIRPNPFMTWSQWLANCANILYSTNTLFIVPMYDDDRNITGYFPCPPTSVSLIEWKEKVWIKFRFPNGEVGAAPWDKCAILTRFQLNGLFGEDNGALTDTMSLMSLNSQAVKEAMKDGSSYRFLARLLTWSSDKDYRKEAELFSEVNFKKSAKNSNGLLLFPKNFENIQQISSKPYTVDAEQMKLIQGNIEKYFGVNEDLIKNSATSDKLESFYAAGVEPFQIQLGEAMSHALYSDREIALGNIFKLTANRLQFMSMAQKLTMAKEFGDRGFLMIDEARELFGLAQMPNGAGQHAVIRGEYYMHDKEDKPKSDAPPETPSSDGDAEA